MDTRSSVGIEQARANLPALVAQADAGKTTVITRHGKPIAAVVPVAQARSRRPGGGLLALRGSGAGLWGPDVRRALAELRREWD